MHKLTIMAAAVAVLATGCISVNKNEAGHHNLVPNLLKDIIHEKYSVAEKPITAENTVYSICGGIVFGNQATHIADHVPTVNAAPSAVNWSSATMNSGLMALAQGWSPLSKTENTAMNGAYAIACERAKADAIVGARYTLTVTDYVVYKVVNAKITGYPATMTGVEVIDAAKNLPAPVK